MLVHVLDGTSIRCKCTDLDPATIPGLWVSKKCESSSGWLPTILNWSNCRFKVRMLGCGQTITVSTQELSVAAKICSITFSQWAYSCASFLVANWILVIGNIQQTQALARECKRSRTILHREVLRSNSASTWEWSKKQSLHPGVFNGAQNPPHGSINKVTISNTGVASQGKSSFTGVRKKS